MGRTVQVVAETDEDVIDLATPSPWSDPRAAVRAILSSGVLGSTG